ncbi:hypothetical protein HELRODRAFT_191947 [Helobdella robusta]|uniref:SH2 domain-containing protein n=1 Tax=Helobdella robusta TaxID=6412 RepID=T1FTF9_HELRO|nr:hypothetical protein HELRODRAFT_191947 [Helobdella robusta]ESO03751.1 hypothetical protein HELRODRAFT_191947 [Helobdella robusta]
MKHEEYRVSLFSCCLELHDESEQNLPIFYDGDKHGRQQPAWYVNGHRDEAENYITEADRKGHGNFCIRLAKETPYALTSYINKTFQHFSILSSPLGYKLKPPWVSCLHKIVRYYENCCLQAKPITQKLRSSDPTSPTIDMTNRPVPPISPPVASPRENKHFIDRPPSSKDEILVRPKPTLPFTKVTTATKTSPMNPLYMNTDAGGNSNALRRSISTVTSSVSSRNGGEFEARYIDMNKGSRNYNKMKHGSYVNLG